MRPVRLTSFVVDGPELILLPAVVEVSDAYDYAIWGSYAEIYNEKIYDLLDSPNASSVPPPSPHSNPRLGWVSLPPSPPCPSPPLASSAVSTTSVGSGGNVKRKALSLKHDKDGVNKYVSGLTEVRIWSAAGMIGRLSLPPTALTFGSVPQEARTVLRKGQINRRVFSTLLNRTSSPPIVSSPSRSFASQPAWLRPMSPPPSRTPTSVD